MADHIDDRAPEERLIGFALTATRSAAIPALDWVRVHELVSERIASGRSGSTRSARSPRGQQPRRALIAIGLLALVGGSAALIVSRGLWTQAPPVVTILPGSWAYTYGSITEIGRASELVVVGTVARVTSEAPTGAAPQTIFAVQVDEVLKGRDVLIQLRVAQEGGKTGPGMWVEFEDYPLMAAGDHVLLFLRPVSIRGEAAWAIVGGPQGRLVVNGDSVTDAPGSFGLALPSGTTVSQIAAQISVK